MTIRLRKEVQIFKEVYQHSRFGDHVQEVRPNTEEVHGSAELVARKSIPKLQVRGLTSSLLLAGTF